jgi:hypothetical protein
MVQAWETALENRPTPDMIPVVRLPCKKTVFTSTMEELRKDPDACQLKMRGQAHTIETAFVRKVA